MQSPSIRDLVEYITVQLYSGVLCTDSQNKSVPYGVVCSDLQKLLTGKPKNVDRSRIVCKSAFQKCMCWRFIEGREKMEGGYIHVYP